MSKGTKQIRMGRVKTLLGALECSLRVETDESHKRGLEEAIMLVHNMFPELDNENAAND